MKPIKLTMHNFGPFLDETIDFTQLTASQLFLICGRTGAGKTMIFDAMTFALYGSSSTNERNELALRSQFAQDNEPARLNFIFKVHDKTYEVDRTLKYFKPGVKTAVAPKCTLYDTTADEKKIIAVNVTPCREAVIDIIKLDADQFRQILILPQGAFKKFLVSDSKDKQKVLSTLFSTNRFKLIEEKVKQQAVEARNNIAALEANIVTLLKQYKGEAVEEMSTDNEFAVRESQLSESVSRLEESSRQLQQFRKQHDQAKQQLEEAESLNQALDKLEIVQKEYHELLQQSDMLKHNEQLMERKERLESLVNIHEQLEKKNIRLQQIEADYQQQLQQTEDYVSKHAVVIDERELMDREQEAIQKIQVYNDKTKKYYDDKSLYAGLNEEIAQLNGQISELNQSVRAQQQMNEQVEQELTTLENIQRQYWEMKEQMAAAQGSVNDYDRELLQMKENNDKVRQHEEMLRQYRHDADTLQRLKADLPSHWEHIVPLQQQLHTGDRCPVCRQMVMHELEGLSAADYEAHDQQIKEIEALQLRREIMLQMTEALEHIQTEPLENKLKEVSNELNRLKITVHQYEQQLEQLAQLKEQHQQLSRQLTEQKAQLLKAESELPYKKKMLETFKSDTHYDEFTIFADEWKQNDIKIRTYLQKANDLEKEEENLALNIAHSKELCGRLENERTLLKEEVDDQKIMIDDKLTQLGMTIEDVVSAEAVDYHEVASWIDHYKSRCAVLKSQIEQQQQLIQGRSFIDVQPLQEQLHHLTKQIEELSEQYKQTEFIIEHNSALLHSVKQQLELFKDQQQHTGQLQLLKRLFSGENDERMNLENYVLSFYMQQSLTSANLRLLEMTHHRYEFRRKEDITDRKKQSGLDIEIYDYYSNQIRDITTLSGGETFLASLSLALGLSDYVTQISGGITLESVFIDEGFGTLDNETLETAVSALIDLEQSGKMVGIISHVQLLKDRMPAILTVNNAGYSSTTSFEFK